MNANANEKLIELIKGKFKLEDLELENEQIKDWDNILKPVKEAHPEVFEIVEAKGFTPNNPPQGDRKTTGFTMQQIRNMTAKQINDNWDSGIKQALEKGE